MWRNGLAWVLKNEKIILLGLLILGVSAASFAIGYSLAVRQNITPIIIEKCAK